MSHLTLIRAGLIGASMLAMCGLLPALAVDTGSVRVASDEVKWAPSPVVPKGIQMAVLFGNPRQAGLYTIRLKFPPYTKLPTHSHPDMRVRTIISGTYYSAVGEYYDAAKMVAYPPGTVSHVPPKVWQYAESRDEEVIFQITGIGPTGIDYLNPADDPRKERKPT